MLPGLVQQEVQDAFSGLGYASPLLETDFDFALTASSNGITAALPLAAFWQEPHDQFSSALAVRDLVDDELGHVHIHLEALAKHLWLPYLITLARDTYKLWQPASSNDSATAEQFFECQRGELSGNLLQHKEMLAPARIGQQKRRWRQAALYGAVPDTNSFFDWAFQATEDELHKLVRRVMHLPEGATDTDQVSSAQWLLRLLAARIAWDKGSSSIPAGNRSRGADILDAACSYPGATEQPPPGTEELADEVARQLSQTNMRALDGALLSHVIQSSALPPGIRKVWKLYPTPPHIAWEMMKSLPVETIPSEQRLVWDGTCGTGTLLVAGLERLRAADSSTTDSKFRQRVAQMVAGNDKQHLLSELTRIVLDLELAEPVQWRITTASVEQTTVDTIGHEPTIVVGNPPFEASRGKPERAITVLNHYLKLLPASGLISVILPRTLLSGGLTAGKQLRERLLDQ